MWSIDWPQTQENVLSLSELTSLNAEQNRKRLTTDILPDISEALLSELTFPSQVSIVLNRVGIYYIVEKM
jgi:hypothetical protein